MDSSPRALRIVHVFRAPLGGLFRHVADLAREQSERGHQIGLIADSLTGGETAQKILDELAPRLALGCLRLPIVRPARPADFFAYRRIAQRLRELAPDIVHGHGAKGGAFARLPALLGDRRPVRVYTPHGGSFNYPSGSWEYSVYMAAERALAPGSDLLLFESDYIRKRYDAVVGANEIPRRIIVNGIGEQELIPALPDEDANDLLYVGELRSAKGIDTLLEAMPLVNAHLGRPLTLTLVGSGPDESFLRQRALAAGLERSVRFAGAMPARQAFRRGRLLVVPSRAESLPYIVLEAAGARMPMTATNVGGIPEIFGPYADRLIPCDQPETLAQAIVAQKNRDVEERQRQTETLAQFVAEKFSLKNMAEGVLAGYREALTQKAAHGFAGTGGAPSSFRPVSDQIEPDRRL